MCYEHNSGRYGSVLNAQFVSQLHLQYPKIVTFEIYDILQQHDDLIDRIVSCLLCLGLAEHRDASMHYQ